MDFFEVIGNRHSIRKYQRKDIEEEKMQKILETAKCAPSAGNLQAYDIFVIKDQELKKRLALASWEQDFIGKAPVVIVFCSNPERSGRQYGERGKSLYSVQDATIAASHAQLAAASLGLASVWVGAFEEEEILKILKDGFEFKDKLMPVCILPIGYPAEEGEASTRRSDTVHEI